MYVLHQKLAKKCPFLSGMAEKHMFFGWNWLKNAHFLGGSG
jgi:hypothetical protein